MDYTDTTEWSYDHFSMFTPEGNRLVTDMVNDFNQGVERLIKRFDEDRQVVRSFGHIEIGDTAVREAIFAALERITYELAERTVNAEIA